MTMISEIGPGFPAWLPDDARLYLRHTGEGISIRAIARTEGLHASTVLRKVRAWENRRDDPLVDEAFDRIGRSPGARDSAGHTAGSDTQVPNGVTRQMTTVFRKVPEIADEATISREARRVLRRLCEPGTILVIAPDMEKAVVLKGTARLTVVERKVAQAFALKDWIAVTRTGKVTTYEITGAGRAALKRYLADDPARTEEVQRHAEQHRDWAERELPGDGEAPRRVRFNLAESPLSILARRRDKDGETFLTPEMVTAGERLREDFELAQMGPRVTQNWDRFLTAGDRGGFSTEGGSGGSGAARDRVAAALRELGPGLGDMVLRCCCVLEGLEEAERRLGWSARSGKIVLRIALMRLARHYQDAYGKFGPKIG